MKLKNLIITSILLLLLTVPGFATNAPAVKSTTPSETPATVRSEELLTRLKEIEAMDVKAMTRSEKRKLRREVRSIDKEMREINDGGGVYISVGGIIIILLLLILLL